MNFKCCTKLFLLVAVIALSITSVLAQQGTAILRGTVTDSSGAVVPGATVTIVNQETGLNRRKGSSNDEGNYTFSSLRPGLYRITIEATGFKKTVKDNIRLNVGETQDFNFEMETGGTTETVNVTADEPLVETSSNKIGGTITEEELIELPSVNRNFIGFVGLVPGVVPNISTESFGSDSISTNGQDPRNNNFQLDGANNNDDVIGQRAGAQTRTALEAVQEFQILTNQYDAEFGRTSGGVINAITKSGKNTFNGSVFGYFQDDALDATNRFTKLNNLTTPESNQRQFGGTIGGPIVKNVAHFFFSYEKTNIDRAIIGNFTNRPDLNFTTSTKTRAKNSMLRFDVQPTDDHQISFRWLREASPQLNQIIGNVTLAASREEADVDQTYVVSETWNIGPNLVNDLRLGYTREDVAFANPCFNGGTPQRDCGPTLRFATFTDGNSNVASARVNNSYRAADTLVWINNDHTMKFGGSYNFLQAINNNESNTNGIFTFPTDAPFNAADPSTYPERFSIRVPGADNVTIEGKYYSIFAQDSWQINQKLTLNLGIRYDNESITDDDDNISPRLGFAYDPKGDGKTVIRGGFGLFYQSSQFSNIDDFVRDQPFTNSFTRNFPLNQRDPGPRLGQFPTDPTLVNGPTVQLAAVAAAIGPGATVVNTSPTIDNRDRVVPYTRTISFGVQRELARNLALTVDFIHTDGKDQFLRVSLNPLARAGTVFSDPVSRQFSTLGQVFAASQFPLITDVYAGQNVELNATSNPQTWTNLGETTYDALQISFNKRYSQGFRFKASYTLSRATGTTDDGLFSDANFQTQSALNLSAQDAPTDFNRKHNFVFSGLYRVPHTRGLIVSTVIRALSGSSLTIFDGLIDTDSNGRNFDPSSSGGSFTNSRTFPNGETLTFNTNNDGGVNGATNPGLFQIDLRLAYKFNITEKVNTGFTFEIFNLANRTNFNGVSGRTDRATSFLIPTSSQIPRKIQLGFRVAF